MDTSKRYFYKANRFLVGGVNSPVRTGRSVDHEAVFVKSGEGPFLIDVDDNRYLDLVNGYGPVILGHGHPQVVEAVLQQVKSGCQFGASTELEIILATEICKAFHNIEKVRLTNSGTESVLLAIRLARAVTGKAGIIKFAGCYHGHADDMLVKSGSGVLSLSLPDSPGTLPESVKHTHVCQYNDIGSLESVFSEMKGDLAAVILEIVAGNMGVVLPEPDFLDHIHALCEKHQVLLIADEVMTGFRKSFSGAQHDFNLKTDITCLGKIIGGGLPVGAVGATAEIMDRLAPEGNVYHAGTFCGNPVVMAAGNAVLHALQDPGTYPHLTHIARIFAEGLKSELTGKYPVQIQSWGTMASLFFSETPVRNLHDVQGTNSGRFSHFYRLCLEQGLFLPPSKYEAWFLSLAWNQVYVGQAIDIIVESVKDVFS
jgi:glutamate-1-semialdehyde 2,1-aminomutase